MVKRVALYLAIALLALPTARIGWRSATPVAAVPAQARAAPDGGPVVGRLARTPAAGSSPHSATTDFALDRPKLSARPSSSETAPPSEDALAIASLRYGETLRALDLPAETTDELIRLLAERALVVRDVLNVSRAAGLTVDSAEPAVRALLATAQGPSDAAIRQLTGAPGFDALVRRDENLRVRSVVTELQQQLERSSTPLREDRADALGRILFFTAPRGADGASDLGTITTAAVSRSWEVLSQPQVAALERLQRQQEDLRQARGRR